MFGAEKGINTAIRPEWTPSERIQGRIKQVKRKRRIMPLIMENPPKIKKNEGNAVWRGPWEL
jgi:hypothetical protein